MSDEYDDDDRSNPGGTTSTAETKDDCTASLKETLRKVEGALLPSIEQLCDGGSDSGASVVGLDFLHVKNTVMLSYLIEWIAALRDDNNNNSNNGTASSVASSRRLLEIKTVLDKSRGLDKKLRYQIDKLLAAAASSSTSFASGGRGNGDNNEDANSNNNNTTFQEEHMLFQTSMPEDPLQFRPDPKSLLDNEDNSKSNSNDDDDDVDRSSKGNKNGELDSEQDDGSDNDPESDDDLAAARQALALSSQVSEKKKRHSKHTNGEEEDDGDDQQHGEGDQSSKSEGAIYRAPRMTAVPYAFDGEERQKEKRKRQQRRLRASELAQTLRAQYGDAPDQEDIHGGGSSEMYGKQRSASKKLAQHEAERIEYEESAMIRLIASRKEKKEKKRVERMMEGGSNLNEIANLGNLVRETEAFGRGGDGGFDEEEEQYQQSQALDEFRMNQGSHSKGDDDTGRKRYANGKRRREGSSTRDQSKKGKSSKHRKPKNSLQAALYGK